MKCTLTITASTTTLASLLSIIENYDVEVKTAPSVDEPVNTTVIVEQTPISVESVIVEQPIAPVTPVVAPTPASVDAELDANGIPWDDRIHAKTKARVKDDTWRKKRGVDDVIYESVVAELKASVAPAMPTGDAPVVPVVEQPVAPVVPVTPPMPNGDTVVPNAPVTDPVVSVAPTVAPTPAPVADIVQPVEPVTAQPVAAGSVDFNGFMQTLGKNMQTNPTKVNTIYLTTIKDEIGTAFNTSLSAITDIAANPAMIDYAIQLMQRDNTWA